MTGNLEKGNLGLHVTIILICRDRVLPKVCEVSISLLLLRVSTDCNSKKMSWLVAPETVSSRSVSGEGGMVLS